MAQFAHASSFVTFTISHNQRDGDRGERPRLIGSKIEWQQQAGMTAFIFCAVAMYEPAHCFQNVFEWRQPFFASPSQLPVPASDAATRRSPYNASGTTQRQGSDLPDLAATGW